MKCFGKMWVLMAVFVGLIMGMASPAAHASNATWWHALSQSSRNSKILNKGLGEVGDTTGLQCKEWVREIVKDASLNTVTIPSTKPNMYQWYPHPDVDGIPQPSPITWAAPGSIIQMKWTTPNGNVTPHTAIVKSHTSSGMYWVDCNWNFDTKVIVHFVAYSTFADRVGSSYTIYYIK
jgi:hypothetical protein